LFLKVKTCPCLASKREEIIFEKSKRQRGIGRELSVTTSILCRACQRYKFVSFQFVLRIICIISWLSLLKLQQFESARSLLVSVSEILLPSLLPVTLLTSGQLGTMCCMPPPEEAKSFVHMQSYILQVLSRYFFPLIHK
jgi:hypothetical protein